MLVNLHTQKKNGAEVNGENPWISSDKIREALGFLWDIKEKLVKKFKDKYGIDDRTYWFMQKFAEADKKGRILVR